MITLSVQCYFLCSCIFLVGKKIRYWLWSERQDDNSNKLWINFHSINCFVVKLYDSKKFNAN